MATKKTMLRLPEELIIEILLRLPVKSLISFKCVCKLWFSIISDTSFANSQFELTAAKHTDRVLNVLITSPPKIHSIDLHLSLDDDSVFYSLNPNFLPSKKPESGIQIKGSCRGFILFLYSCSSFYIWNPSTGVNKNIPLSPLSPLNLNIFDLGYLFDSVYFYGFGYDQSTDDYLIVLLSSDKNSSYLEFFSLRANTWKQIDDDVHKHYSNNMEDNRLEGSLFNGAIHWYANRGDLEKNVIVAFDLLERKLLEMNLPDKFDHKRHYCSLWVFQEFLSLCAMEHYNNKVEIWVMKEYNVHSSWKKTHVLPIDPTTYFYYPLSSTKSGDILGTDGHIGFVKYNDEGQLLGHRSYCAHTFASCVAIMYTESLLSLPGDTLQA